MPQSQFNESNTVLNYVNTIVTLIGVIFGWWSRIVPLVLIRKVPIPRVPYVYTLLLAGESGVFTSSLFDSIHDGARQVSWVPLYETFFVEAAWHSLDLWSKSDQQDRVVDPLEQTGDVTIFFKNLAKFCWGLALLPREFVRSFLELPQKSSEASKLLPSPEMDASVQRRANRVVWKQLRIAEGKNVSWIEHRFHRYFGVFSIKCPKYILVARSRIPIVDRHLLYYSWNVWDDKGEESQKVEDSKKDKDSKKGFSWLWQKRYKVFDPEKKKPKSNHSHPPPPKVDTEPNPRPPILVKAHHELPPPDYVDKQTTPSTKSTTDSKDMVRADGNESICAAVDKGKIRKMSPQEKRRQEEIWKWGLQSLWIHDDKPCIQVSEDELGALAIVMGMPLRCSEKDSLPSGPSAFSPCLTSTNDGCLTRLKVAYGRFRTSSPNVGSGYSILFAMYMGCNCLPFAHEYVPPIALNMRKFNLEVFHAIHVTAEVLSLIKVGNTIWTGVRGAGFSTASSKYLARLPSFAAPYLYDSSNTEEEKKMEEEKNLIQEERQPGLIYKRDGEERQLAGSWTNAVAGIALGGLVPMAAKPLIEAVKFTFGGGIDIKDLDILEDLVDLVQQQTREKFSGGDSGIQLFGPQRQYFSDLTARDDKIDLGISLSNQDRILDIVLVLVRYNTLLERLIAMLPPAKGNPLDKVFSVLCARISESYKTACENEKVRLEKERVEKERQEKEKLQSNKLEKVKPDKDKLAKNKLEKDKLEKDKLEKDKLEKDKLEKDKLEKDKLEKGKDKETGKGDYEAKPTGEQTEPNPRVNDLMQLLGRANEAPHTWTPTVKDCAITAEYIIKAWTCIAKKVDWRDVGEKADEDEEHMYKPVPFANLPDVSLWE